MLWRGVGSVLAGCGAGSLVLLTVWLWPGQSVPPSMGPAVVVPVLHGPTSSSTAAPGTGRPTAVPPAAPPDPSRTSSGGWPVSPSPPPAAEDATDESREGPGYSGHDGVSPIVGDDEAASRAPRGEVDDDGDEQDDEDEEDDDGEVFPGHRGDAGDEWDD